ncbi:MAG: S-layer homology domain-containing protein [Candidatus Peregrinibacteria bacterium]|nr:S-layer homology domain-containing protein [Candidatus Peregrinibacteria bacterium]MCB9807760.1 S-layer homology domain-containing protein [Candidatus Peribacteria bacterium]
MRVPHFPTILLLSGVVITTVGAQFFDEIVALQEELRVWEESNAADFSDVIEQLDDITGAVFRDVSDQDWFNPYVASLSEWGIVSGFKDTNGRPTGEYRPGNNVTIAEVLKMAMEAAQVDTTNCTNVPLHPQAANHWARAYIACAETMGVRLLDPRLPADINRPAKRAEVLTIIHDTFHDEVLPLYSSFTDTQGHRYEADIAYANLYGIISGDTDAQGAETGTFRPDDSINRAEVAKIIYEKLKLQVVDAR